MNLSGFWADPRSKKDWQPHVDEWVGSSVQWFSLCTDETTPGEIGLYGPLHQRDSHGAHLNSVVVLEP